MTLKFRKEPKGIKNDLKVPKMTEWDLRAILNVTKNDLKVLKGTKRNQKEPKMI